MSEPFESEVIHTLKNHLSVITVLSELLLASLPEGETRSDVSEIHKASLEALALVPRLRDDRPPDPTAPAPGVRMRPRLSPRRPRTPLA